MTSIYESYFNGPREIIHFRHNDACTNMAAIAKVVSMFTVVIPLLVALAWGASTLCDRTISVVPRDELPPARQQLQERLPPARQEIPERPPLVQPPAQQQIQERPPLNPPAEQQRPPTPPPAPAPVVENQDQVLAFNSNDELREMITLSARGGKILVELIRKTPEGERAKLIQDLDAFIDKDNNPLQLDAAFYDGALKILIQNNAVTFSHLFDNYSIEGFQERSNFLHQKLALKQIPEHNNPVVQLMKRCAGSMNSVDQFVMTHKRFPGRNFTLTPLDQPLKGEFDPKGRIFSVQAHFRESIVNTLTTELAESARVATGCDFQTALNHFKQESYQKLMRVKLNWRLHTFELDQPTVENFSYGNFVIYPYEIAPLFDQFFTDERLVKWYVDYFNGEGRGPLRQAFREWMEQQAPDQSLFSLEFILEILVKAGLYEKR